MSKQYFEEAILATGHLVDAWLPIRARYSRVPGVSVGIVHNGKLRYQRGFGFADVGKKEKVTDQTLFRIASISKTFTAVAIMQLVEAGKLRLDDRVSQYVPWLKGKRDFADAERVTIRQILSHSSGLFRDGDTPHWSNGKFPKDLQKSFSADALIIEHGTKFKYTNYGFSLLGLVVEQVTRQTYSDYCQAHILDTLGMKKSAPDFRKGLKHVATGYGRDIPDTNTEVFSHYPTNAYAPAAGYLSNVADLSRYLAALSLQSQKLLGRDAKKELFQPHRETRKGNLYGLGFEMMKNNNRTIVGHGGGFNGFITYIGLDATSDIGVIVLTNCIGISASEIAMGIFDGIYTYVDRPELYRGADKKLKKYEGLYRTAWGDVIVAQFGKQLIATTPEHSWPIHGATRYVPTKIQHKFQMQSENVFESYGEHAVFTNFRGGSPHTLLEGSMPLQRVLRW